MNIQPVSAHGQLPILQEDAGKAQDAATAVASLESELEQATRREEQLRNSRAQCEYQLQQAGEVAQSQVNPTLCVVFTHQDSSISLASDGQHVMRHRSHHLSVLVRDSFDEQHETSCCNLQAVH